MARGIHRLSPRDVLTKGDGLHPDGGGLYLQVKGGGRSWIFRYEGGNGGNMGLGSVHTVGLAEARERARVCRLQLLDGIDPLEARKAAKLARKLEAAKEVTFEACVDGWMATKTWSEHSAKVARSMLRRFAYPELELGKIPIQRLSMPEGVSLVRKVLEPLWLTKTSTTRTRMRILSNVLRDF